MPLYDDLESAVRDIFSEPWDERDGRVVPDDESLRYGNDAINLEATVLYADMADSTVLVDEYDPKFAAEIYKAFLLCCVKIIGNAGGEITAYDGDRVMAVFLGTAKNTSAVRAALRINYAVDTIVQPALEVQYPQADYTLRHVVGIDTSKLLVAKTGVRGANDLVWVGRAANYAAKLSSSPDDFQTYITEDVHRVMSKQVKETAGENMWEPHYSEELDGLKILRSTWWLPFT